MRRVCQNSMSGDDNLVVSFYPKDEAKNLLDLGVTK